MCITKGIKGKQKTVVSNENTAKACESGSLEVFATPALAALMEKTCMLSVCELLDEGFTTVGTELDIKHIAATPVGAEVVCESELIEIDRRRLVFKITASDCAGVISNGVHTRFIVEIERFMNKAQAKIK